LDEIFLLIPGYEFNALDFVVLSGDNKGLVYGEV
jgi:hypothetical protein